MFAGEDAGIPWPSGLSLPALVKGRQQERRTWTLKCRSWWNLQPLKCWNMLELFFQFWSGGSAASPGYCILSFVHSHWAQEFFWERAVIANLVNPIWQPIGWETRMERSCFPSYTRLNPKLVWFERSFNSSEICLDNLNTGHFCEWNAYKFFEFSSHTTTHLSPDCRSFTEVSWRLRRWRAPNPVESPSHDIPLKLKCYRQDALGLRCTRYARCVVRGPTLEQWMVSRESRLSSLAGEILCRQATGCILAKT